MVTVADGHGSSVHAETGAQLAVDVAATALETFVDNLGPEHSADARAVHAFAQHPFRVQVVREWVRKVREAAGNDEVDLKDYGTTLLFAAVTPDFVLLGQLGDGDILVVDGAGAISRPIPADPSSFAEETLSLCLPEAWSSLRVHVTPRTTEETLLLICTDGYGKSYATESDFERIGPDYLEMVRELGLAEVEKHLEAFLTEVTRGGSGDDIALGLIYLPGRTPEPRQVEVVAEQADPEDHSAPTPAEVLPPTVPASGRSNTHREPGEEQ